MGHVVCSIISNIVGSSWLPAWWASWLPGDHQPNAAKFQFMCISCIYKVFSVPVSLMYSVGNKTLLLLLLVVVVEWCWHVGGNYDNCLTTCGQVRHGRSCDLLDATTPRAGKFCEVLSAILNDVMWSINTVRLRQDSRHFTDDIFKCIFLNKNICISIKTTLKFVPEDSISNK